VENVHKSWTVLQKTAIFIATNILKNKKIIVLLPLLALT
jgi:hypothetical protein